MDKIDGRFNPMNMNDLTRDAFRTLRQNISFSGGDKDVHTLVVTSAVPSEGKTSVSIGLGISMAESMKNTLIVECDCRRPSVGNRLKLRPPKNWIDVLYQTSSLEEAIVPTKVPNLYFLDAEPGLVHSVELLSSVRFREMIATAQKHFDFIIFDTPPLGSFIDAAVLSEYADGAMVVIMSGSKEIRLIRETLEQLKKANARILGIVLNRVNAHHSSYYKYGEYYYRNRAKSRAGKDSTAGDKASNRQRSDKKAGKKQAAVGETPNLNADVPFQEEDIGWEEYTRNRAQQATDQLGSATYHPRKDGAEKSGSGAAGKAEMKS